MTAEPLVLTAIEGAIATVTFNRPTRRNALTRAMYTEAVAALQFADAHADVRVIILTGAGGYFTAGNDLGDFIGYKRGGAFEALDFLHALIEVKKPLIAAVERGAVGIGTTLLQHCDFAYAGKSTKFLMPFTPFGICPEGGASRVLAHGPMSRQAMRWLMLGEPFTAEEALIADVLTAITEDDNAYAAAVATAQKLAALDPDAVQTSKALIRAARPNMAETFDLEGAQFTRLLEGEVSQSALRAFAAKSK